MAGTGKDLLVIGFCVVDDHEIVHDGLQAMAEREPDLEFLGAATTTNDGASLIARVQPDVAIVDLRIGEHSTGSGIDLCRKLAACDTAPAVILFSAYGNTELLSQAIDAGASGYVVKETSVRRLPEILRTVHQTGSYFDSELAAPLLRRTARGRFPPAEFGERELSIVRAIGRGADNHEIGALLHISPHTVKYHVASMMRRHHVRRRAELVRVAADLHLLDP